MEELIGDHRPIEWNLHKQNWPHLSDIAFPVCGVEEKVEMILGAACADLMAGPERVGPACGPVAKFGCLGWTVAGPIRPQHSQ